MWLRGRKLESLIEKRVRAIHKAEEKGDIDRKPGRERGGVKN